MSRGPLNVASCVQISPCWRTWIFKKRMDAASSQEDAQAQARLEGQCPHPERPPMSYGGSPLTWGAGWNEGSPGNRACSLQEARGQPRPTALTCEPVILGQAGGSGKPCLCPCELGLEFQCIFSWGTVRFPRKRMGRSEGLGWGQREEARGGAGPGPGRSGVGRGPRIPAETTSC